MHDVARTAGVSLSTVSRVVNRDPTVGARLATRVRTTVAELGYRRDMTASSLRRADRVTSVVGLIFDDLANPFFSALHRGIEDVARRRGVFTMVGSSDDAPDRELELIEAFAARGVDGMIIAPVGDHHTQLDLAHENGVALVFVDRSPDGLDADTVVVDNAGGAQLGVEHLLVAGHRRIGYLGDRRQIFSSGERLRGYRAALAEAGIEIDQSLVRLDVRSSSIATAEVHGLLSLPEPPTAVFAAQNLITIGAVRALTQLGVEDAIALVGFDDVALADAVKPGLTVIAQDPTELGRTAATMLFARIDGDDSPARLVTEPTRLVVRGSGEIPPPGRPRD